MPKFNIGGAGTGALSGAAAGSAISPGWGTLAGAIFGAGAGGLASPGKQAKQKAVSTLTGGQNQLLSSIIEQLMGQQGQGGAYGNAMNVLQQYLNPESDIYKNFEAPYMRQFNEQIVPGLANQFARFGNESGALGSSQFAQTLGGASAGLVETLAALKSGMQGKAAESILGNFNNLAQLGLGTQAIGYNERAAEPSLINQLFTQFAGKMSPGDIGKYGKEIADIDYSKLFSFG